MARERMVTRTINVTECEAMCVDVTTAETTIQTFELTGESYTPEKALKELKKHYETDTLKLVVVQGMHTREELYGLLEVDFLKVAHRLDDSRKIIEE